MSVYDWELSFQACLDQIKALEQGAEIPQSLIATLFHMFGHKVEDAMNSVKVSTITQLKDELGREIFEYISPNDKYYVYPNIMFCTCPAFKRQVLTMDQTRVCKHVIGTRIAVALDDETVKSGFLESSEMAKIYCDMNHCTTRRPVLPDTPAPGPGHNDTNDTDLSTESLASDPDV